jgi:ubiquinone biosynthesis protein
MAGLAQRTPWGQLYNPIEMVAHFARTLNNELDYRKEAANAEKFSTSFAAEAHLYVPRVYWDYTTQRVLVLEKLEGIKIDQMEALAAANVDRRQIATYAARIIIKEIIEDGFFHADPHPGNFMVMPNRRLEDGTEVDITVGAMDFGMVGHVSKSDRANLLQIYSLALKGNAQGMVDLLHRIGALDSESDFDGLARELDRVLTQYRDMPSQHFQTRRVMEDLMQVAYHYHVSLPPDMWLLFKTLLMMDGLARQLDPDFNVFETFTPHLQRLRAEAYLPWVWGPAVLDDLEPLLYALRDIPSMGENLLRGLQRGKLPFSVSFGANKETLDRIDRLSTRLALSILVAAFILGLALLLPAAATNRTAEILVAIGFVAALGLGVWIVFSILRAGR